MRRLAAVGVLIAVAACAGGPGADPLAGSASPAPPNIVLIVSDDAGYADIGAFGDPEMPTPRIDELAAGGVRFTQGYNAASVCSPSRAGLLTGRYPQRFGHEFNIARGRQPGPSEPGDVGLPTGEETIADALGALGYRTAVFGKWHLGLSERFRPLERGFDEFFGFLYGSRGYFAIDADGGPPTDEGVRLWHDREIQPEPEGYLTDLLAGRAAAFIADHRDEPFFAFVSFNAVHTPMHAKPEDEAAFAAITDERRRKLAAMTVSLDAAVGTIVDALRDNGLEDNTLLFFVNDNGGATNNASRNGMLRGQKGDKFEGGIRVPFIARWPARLPRGDDFDDPVTSMDILPTAVAAAGGTPSGDLDGVDLLPFLTGEQPGPPHETLFWRRGVIAAVRHATGAGDLKLIRVDSTPTWLFNLSEDPYETSNLLETDALGVDEVPTVAYLVSKLGGWEAELAQPLWREAPQWSASQIEKHTPGTAQPPMVQQRAGYTPTAAGAPSTDIYLGTLARDGDALRVTDVANITDRDGYDNQPAFEPGGTTLLYTSARNRTQSDVYRHDVEAGTTRQVTQTTASEYSPTPLPDGSGFSSIHESVDGQLLWRYASDGTGRGAILENVQPVGYHAWGDDNLVIMFVLGSGAEPATLQLGDLRTGEAEVLAESPGRSLHKVPGRRALSFVRKVDDENWWIEALDLDTGEYTRLLQTLPGREDYAWTPDGAIVMGDGSRLFVARPGGNWVEIADLSAVGVVGITRLAIDDTGTRIAIVGNREQP